MKRDVIEVAEDLYCNSRTVVKNIIIDLLERVKTKDKITISDIYGYNSCTSVTVTDKGVMRTDWDEDYHSGSPYNYQHTLITDNKDYIRIVQTAINLVKIYKM